MLKSKVLASMVLGLLFISTAFPQQVKTNNPARAQQGTGLCSDQATEAYIAAKAACDDYRQQLNDLSIRLASLRNEWNKLWDECAKSNDPKSAPCEQLAMLSAGRYSIAQQEYINFAQKGCVEPVLPVKQIEKCTQGAAGTVTASDGKTPVNPSPVTKPKPVQDATNAGNPRPTPGDKARVPQKPISNVQAGKQSVSTANTTPTRTAGDAGPRGQSGASGFVNNSTAVSAANVSSTGAGKIK